MNDDSGVYRLAAEPDVSPTAQPQLKAAPKRAGSPPPPQSQHAAPQQDRTKLQQRVLAALDGSIQKIRLPVTYRIGILLAAIVMVLLPLVYIGIIGLVGYGIYLHMVYDVVIMQVPGGRAKIFAFLIYIAPLAAGVILIVFMLKPLFSRPAHDERRRSLRREAEPLLFAFVDRICEIVRAPKPRRIDLDCQVNASASFRRGVLSMLGHDLVLTIGMPLVAGLEMRQFAGILAHEFGHFSQGAGMRLTYIVRAISHWFTRVVYERDEWDQWLEETAQDTDFRIGFILHLARLCVWLTRKILWGLMYVGHAVAGFMLRQMEFDADRYEARLAGSDTFQATARQLIVLSFCHQKALSDLSHYYREGRLGDNIPLLIRHNIAKLPEDAQKQVDEMIAESSTSWFDTHPCDRDRIASAQREAAPGIFHLTESASLLFSDFEASARGITLDFYRSVLGRHVKPDELQPIDDMLGRQSEEIEDFKTLKRYLQASYGTLRPLDLAPWTLSTPQNAQEVADKLKQARQQMLADVKQYLAAYKTYDDADTTQIYAAQAGALRSAGVKVAKDDFPLPLTTTNAVNDAINAARQQQHQVTGELKSFERLAATRLRAALTLSQVPKVAARLQDAEAWNQEAPLLLAILERIVPLVPNAIDVRNERAGLGVLMMAYQSNQQDESTIRAVLKQMSTLAGEIHELRGKLNHVTYPFDHAHGAVSISHYATPVAPQEDNPSALYDAADALTEALLRIIARATGRLCTLAEEVETLLGLERLPDPEDEPEEDTEPTPSA